MIENLLRHEYIQKQAVFSLCWIRFRNGCCGQICIQLLLGCFEIKGRNITSDDRLNYLLGDQIPRRVGLRTDSSDVASLDMVACSLNWYWGFESQIAYWSFSESYVSEAIYFSRFLAVVSATSVVVFETYIEVPFVDLVAEVDLCGLLLRRNAN